MVIVIIPNHIAEGINSEKIPSEDLYKHIIQFNMPEGRKEKKKNTSGFVYFLQCGEYYKIGKTINITRRLTQHAHKTQEPIKIIYKKKVKDCSKTEHYLLALFKKNRIGGTEWITMSEPDLEKIKRVFKKII